MIGRDSYDDEVADGLISDPNYDPFDWSEDPRHDVVDAATGVTLVRGVALDTARALMHQEGAAPVILPAGAAG